MFSVLEKLLRNKTILAVVSIIFGIYMIIARRGVLDTIVRTAGYVLLGIAAAYVIMYFFGPRRDQVQLGYAGAAALGGLLVIWMAPAIINLFPRIAGIFLVLAGVSNLTEASRGESFPAYSKVVPILTIVLGVLIFFHPGSIINAVVVLAGAALIIHGLAELDLIRRIW